MIIVITFKVSWTSGVVSIPTKLYYMLRCSYTMHNAPSHAMHHHWAGVPAYVSILRAFKIIDASTDHMKCGPGQVACTQRMIQPLYCMLRKPFSWRLLNACQCFCIVCCDFDPTSSTGKCWQLKCRAHGGDQGGLEACHGALNSTCSMAFTCPLRLLMLPRCHMCCIIHMKHAYHQTHHTCSTTVSMLTCTT